MTMPITFQGHHRIWHVLPHGDASAVAGVPSGPRLKLAEPHPEAFWFDRRCFDSEEELLRELSELGMDGIPPVRGTAGDGRPLFMDFIEGDTLARHAPHGTPVKSGHLDQIMQRFHQLAAVRPDRVTTPRSCRREDRSPDTRTGDFFRTLITFTRDRSYLERMDEHGALFGRLGIPRDALGRDSWLANEAEQLTPRSFCLLHGDLHRANFIVDPADRLWTIDWELAMLGDPLYDLATHLHLMEYPDDQRDEVIGRWRTTVSAQLPGADEGLAADLPRYLAYKRAQSLLTDTVRHAMKLGATPAGERDVQLKETGQTIHRLLQRAANVLGMEKGEVPGLEDVIEAFGEDAPRRNGHTSMRT